MMKKYAIIVAGGSGSRFGTAIPKQFTLLADRPLLMHTIEAFHHADPSTTIIAVLPSAHQSLWSELCHKYEFSIPHTTTDGGDSRFQSVKNALVQIDGDTGLVAVHDGARPLVTQRMIADSFTTAETCGSAIPTIPLTDSIRRLDSHGSHILDRSTLVAVQTPQTFHLRLLKEAYSTDYSPIFTDDASVAEHSGASISLYPGDVENIKITHPLDIRIAEMILSERNG